MAQAAVISPCRHRCSSQPSHLHMQLPAQPSLAASLPDVATRSRKLVFVPGPVMADYMSSLSNFPKTTPGSNQVITRAQPSSLYVIFGPGSDMALLYTHGSRPVQNNSLAPHKRRGKDQKCRMLHRPSGASNVMYQSEQQCPLRSLVVIKPYNVSPRFRFTFHL